MSLAADIAEYCRNVERKPTKFNELALAYWRDAMVNDQWTQGTMEECKDAIVEACKLGLLCRVSETIWIPVEAEVKKPKQGELF